MNKPMPQRIGLPSGTRAIRLERVAHSYWCVWISANQDFSLGTYLRLYDNGMVERCTLHADGHEDVFLVKPKDE